jgi:hypothetical protein
MGGTSRAYLQSRLEKLERWDLLEAIERGELTHYAAAQAAGCIAERPSEGRGGYSNAAKRVAWAVHRAEKVWQARERAREEARANGLGETVLSLQGETVVSPKIDIRAETVPSPAPPISSSPATRDIIVRLVALDRADLVCLVVERRLSPFQALRIAERGARGTVGREAAEREPGEQSAPDSAPAVAAQRSGPTTATPKPAAAPRPFDPRVLIG